MTPTATPALCDTVLTAAAAVAATRLEVASTTGCNVGDKIRINPGGSNQEDKQISGIGIGSIVLQTQLAKAHAVGERVVEITATPSPTVSSGAFPQTGGSDGSSGMSWSLLAALLAAAVAFVAGGGFLTLRYVRDPR